MERQKYLQTTTQSNLRYHPVELHFSLYLLWLDKILKFHVATGRERKKNNPPRLNVFLWFSEPMTDFSLILSCNVLRSMEWFSFILDIPCLSYKGCTTMNDKNLIFKSRTELPEVTFSNTDELGWINFQESDLKHLKRTIFRTPRWRSKS